MRHQPKPDPSFLQALLAAVPVEALRELVLTLLNGTTASAGEPATEVRKRRGWPKGKRRKARGLVPDPDPKVVTRRRKAAAYQRARRAKLAKAEQAQGTIDAKIATRRKREAERLREKRAKAKRAATAKMERTEIVPAKGKQIDLGPSLQGNGANGQAQASPKTGRGAAERKLLARRQREAERLRTKRAAAKQAKAAKAVGNGTNGNGGKAPEVTAAKLWKHAARLSPKDPPRSIVAEFGIGEAQAREAFSKAILPPGLNSTAIERFLEVRAT